MTESSKERPAEAPTTFISVDNVRALVTLRELGRYKEVHEIVLPKFNETFKDACVTEGEDILTLCFKERGTQKLFVDTDKITPFKMGQPLMDEDWVVLCQALYQSVGEKECDRNARKVEMSVQEDRRTESWSWQGGVAKDGSSISNFGKFFPH